MHEIFSFASSAKASELEPHQRAIDEILGVPLALFGHSVNMLRKHAPSVVGPCHSSDCALHVAKHPRASIELSHWTGRFDLASLLKPRHQHPATYGPGRSDAPASENIRWKMNTKIDSA